MSNEQALKEKKESVSQIKKKFEASNLSVVTEYSGLSVKQLTILRQQLKKENAELSVFKNTLVRFALDEIGVVYDRSLLEGPTAFITTTGDASKVSKLIVKYAKDNEKLVLKAAVLDNQMLNESGINDLAALPSRDELIAKVVGGIKSPLTGLVMALSGPLRGLVYTLQAIKDKKQQ
jgi:large subunit ribosomal protein L10